MMKKATDDKELVALEQKVGTTAFLRLQTSFLRYQTLDREGTDPKLMSQGLQDSKDLAGRVNKALETILGDRAAILKHIKEHNGDREDRAYAAAFEAEPTNAQILWDRAENLRRASRATEAKKLYRQLAESKWQPRFSWLKSQAQAKLQ